MRLFSAAVLGAAAASLVGCATARDVEPVMPITGAEAEIRDPGGRLVARSTATQIEGGVQVRVDAAGLVTGSYAAHVHAVGRCDPPAFESAGPHWNPTDRQHGSQNPQGQHLGDLPNLMVGTDGAGSFTYIVPGASLTGGSRAMLDADGAALVIHTGADDYRTDPSGNSGARLACGEFG